MKILLTNDDGITSEGLSVVARWAATIGEVWIAAPQTQQSGKSHATTIRQPMDVKQLSLGLGEQAAYAVGGTPVDCVRFAMLGLNLPFDLVISGINKGYNMGEDILYSGTVGAIFEAKLRGVCGIALSTEYTTFDSARKNLPNVYRFFVEHDLLRKHSVYNVNIPLDPHGILLTRQGGPYFTDSFAQNSDGSWEQTGYCIHDNRHDLTLDTDATIDGYITVSPLTTDRISSDVWKRLTND